MNFETSNPIAFKSQKVDRLERAYKAFAEIIREYADRENLSEEDVTMLASLLVEAYSMKKAEYMIESKLGRIQSYMNTAFCKAFNFEEDKGNRGHYTDVLYVKHTKQLLTNE